MGTVPIFVGLLKMIPKRALANFFMDSHKRFHNLNSFILSDNMCLLFFWNIDALRWRDHHCEFWIFICFLEVLKRGINKKAENGAQHRNDIALTPLAIPMLAGPGSYRSNRFLSRTQHAQRNHHF
jgi:multiple antibiotic resistance protein